MNNKLLLTISLFVASFNASSTSLFDVPLAKKCYAVYQKLVQIGESQTSDKCISKLNSAQYDTESAALRIVEDDTSNAGYFLRDAIYALKHAQVFGCVDEDQIIEAEQNLADIKARLK